jgi:hypothetical protein
VKFIDEPDVKSLGKKRDLPPEDPHAKRHKELVSSIKSLRESVEKHTDPSFKEGVLDILQGLEALGKQLAALKSNKPRKKWTFTVKRGSNGLIKTVEAE